MKRVLIIFMTTLSVLMMTSCGEVEETFPASVSIVFEAETDGFGRVEGEVNQTLINGELSKQVTAVPDLGYKFAGWSDGVTENPRSGEHFYKDATITARFEQEYLELPVFSFTMASGNEVTSKTEYTEVTLDISNTDEKYCLRNASALIRGRGTSTWSHDKKSYKLKLNEKEYLLGQGRGKAKQWVLLANHCDQSMLRNYMAFYLGGKLDALEYTSSASFVEVMINGEYKGVYLLCEQTQVNKNRVDIETSPTELDTGYLIELDHYAADDEDSVKDVNYFNARGRLYAVKNDVTPEQCKFIKKYIEQTHTAIMRGDRETVETYIDIDSFVDMYLVQEYMMNVDVGWSSFYMYKKPGGKLFFGPVWDFDLAAGNDYRLWNGTYEGVYVGESGELGQENRWFTAIMKRSWFRELVRERWTEKRDVFEGAAAQARKMGDAMKNAAERNYMRWDSMGKRINEEPEQIVALKTYDEHVEYLCSWLSDRFDWLDNFGWNEDYFGKN